MPVLPRLRFRARTPLARHLALLALTAGGSSAAHGYDVVVTDPAYGRVNASAIDQPRLYAVLTDPLAGNAIKTWFNPDSAAVEPVFLTAFVDTGASGFAISQLHASGLYDVASLSLQATDYVGAYTETGIGGTELGDVSRSFGVRVVSGPVDQIDPGNLASYVAYGDFHLWVRREVGTSEVIDLGVLLGGESYFQADPINLIGMPVIRQRRLVLDATPIFHPLEAESGLGTYLLAPGAIEPPTQLTVALRLQDFIPSSPPPGEVLPSHSANPLVSGVTLTHTGGSVSGDWLLDTGAGSSFASFATAKACGLIPSNYATLAAFMADYTGPTAAIGGVGGSLTVPILEVTRISVSTREGATLVWENVDVLIADVAGLAGIFGMNLLIPAVTVDPANPLGSLFDISPGIFRSVVIDTVNAAYPVMRLDAPAAAGTILAWIGSRFTTTDRMLPTRVGLLADPDADGQSNLLEYALGRDPLAADGPPAVFSVIQDAGSRYIALQFTRPIGLTDIAYAVEASSDLQTWSRAPADVNLVSTIAAGPGGETVTYRSALSSNPGARRFLRLVVTRISSPRETSSPSALSAPAALPPQNST